MTEATKQPTLVINIRQLTTAEIITLQAMADCIHPINGNREPLPISHKPKHKMQWEAYVSRSTMKSLIDKGLSVYRNLDGDDEYKFLEITQLGLDAIGMGNMVDQPHTVAKLEFLASIAQYLSPALTDAERIANAEQHARSISTEPAEFSPTESKASVLLASQLVIGETYDIEWTPKFTTLHRARLEFVGIHWSGNPLFEDNVVILLDDNPVFHAIPESNLSAKYRATPRSIPHAIEAPLAPVSITEEILTATDSYLTLATNIDDITAIYEAQDGLAEIVEDAKPLKPRNPHDLAIGVWHTMQAEWDLLPSHGLLIRYCKVHGLDYRTVRNELVYQVSKDNPAGWTRKEHNLTDHEIKEFIRAVDAFTSQAPADKVQG